VVQGSHHRHLCRRCGDPEHLADLGELQLAGEAQGDAVSVAVGELGQSPTETGEQFAVEQGRLGEAPAPAALEEEIEELLVSGHPAVSSKRLQELIVHFSALHQPSMPPELPARLAACIACAKRFSAAEAVEPEGRRPPGLLGLLAQWLGPAPMPGVSWAALAPICLACTIPMMLAPLLALGMSFGLAFGLHLAALATAPLIFWILCRHFRRHRDRLAVWVAGVGVLALAIHFPLHFIPGEGGPVLFTVSDQVGTGLLLAGALLDWRAMRSWVKRQRVRMTALAPALAGTG
jgi:hypothetical protein